MNTPTDSEIVEAFLAHHKFAVDKDMLFRRVVESPWAVDLIWDLAYEDPIRCWTILRAIVALKPPDDAMCSATVALTTLLKKHPISFDMIERDAKTDNNLAELLSWVPDDEGIDSDLWQRIVALSR